MPELQENEFHCCKQEEQIAKMNLLLLGNGNPKDGYVYKVIEMSSQISDINNKLTGINGIVKELHDESVGKKAVTNHKSVTFVQIIQLVGIIISILMCGFAVYNVSKSKTDIEKTVKQEIRNQEGISNVTRSGNIKFNNFGLSDSVNIKEVQLLKQLRNYIDEKSKNK